MDKILCVTPCLLCGSLCNYFCYTEKNTKNHRDHRDKIQFNNL